MGWKWVDTHLVRVLKDKSCVHLSGWWLRTQCLCVSVRCVEGEHAAGGSRPREPPVACAFTL